MGFQYLIVLPIILKEICNDLTKSALFSSDTVLHRQELREQSIKECNESVEKVVLFISSRDNPYATSSASKLYHFTSGQVVPPEASEHLLAFFNRGRNEYINFRKERYITKEKKLSDTIKRISLPPFLPKGKNKKQKPVSSKEGIKKDLQKHIDIARSRGIPMREILQFDHDNFMVRVRVNRRNTRL